MECKMCAGRLGHAVGTRVQQGRCMEDGLHNNADETLRRAVRWSADIVE